jgi:hypothetical protein
MAQRRLTSRRVLRDEKNKRNLAFEMRVRIELIRVGKPCVI